MQHLKYIYNLEHVKTYNCHLTKDRIVINSTRRMKLGESYRLAEQCTLLSEVCAL